MVNNQHKLIVILMTGWKEPGDTVVNMSIFYECHLVLQAFEVYHKVDFKGFTFTRTLQYSPTGSLSGTVSLMLRSRYSTVKLSKRTGGGLLVEGCIMAGLGNRAVPSTAAPAAPAASPQSERVLRITDLNTSRHTSYG